MRGGRRLHCALLPLDEARQIKRGREMRAAGYRKSLLTLSTQSGSSVMVKAAVPPTRRRLGTGTVLFVFSLAALCPIPAFLPALLLSDRASILVAFNGAGQIDT